VAKQCSSAAPAGNTYRASVVENKCARGFQLSRACPRRVRAQVLRETCRHVPARMFPLTGTYPVYLAISPALTIGSAEASGGGSTSRHVASRRALSGSYDFDGGLSGVTAQPRAWWPHPVARALAESFVPDRLGCDSHPERAILANRSSAETPQTRLRCLSGIIRFLRCTSRFWFGSPLESPRSCPLLESMRLGDIERTSEGNVVLATL